MNEYVLVAEAELDLDQIWEYIAQDNIGAADRWIGKLFDAFEALARRLGVGYMRDDLTAYPVLATFSYCKGGSPPATHPDKPFTAPGAMQGKPRRQYRVLVQWPTQPRPDGAMR
jgi:plasmid stabilization system protein ParE